MILTEFVDMKIAPNNYRYWLDKGYPVEKTGGRGAKNTGQLIQVKVSDLEPGSNKDVKCRCDRCGNDYQQRFCRNTDVCYPCRKSDGMLGNTHGSVNKGKKLPHMSGENHPRWNPDKYVSPNKGVGKGKMNKGRPSKRKGMSQPESQGELHPRWNPNKTEFKTFSYKVHWVTTKNYEENKHIINPNDYPRTLCGVEGGWQLDHKISIKEGFKLGWTPEQIANTNNLQMLPWKENRDKWDK